MIATISSWPWSLAHSCAVFPSNSALKSADFSSKSLTIFLLPLKVAPISAVQPEFVFVFTQAEFSIKRSTTFSSPKVAAPISAVQPSVVLAFT